MAKEGPNWEGLLKWSLAHSDGTNPPRNLSEEDRKWFMEAMQAQTLDVVRRMKEITLVMQTPKEVLDAQGVTSADIEELLGELQEHVESIDMANDLHSIGGLVPLIGYLKNPEAGIRAKAADVVSTIVQNNPRSQQLVMEANGFEPLLSNFTSDPDITARTKALGAISCVWKALNLIHYLLHENNADFNVVSELGFPRIMTHLASSDDADVREAALRGLLELSRDKAGATSGSEDDEKLKLVLQERINDISSMSADDLGAAREERQLVDSLWTACYNEPSSLRVRGLLVLPGEDDPAPAPDVAGKFFEPPLRAWAANRGADTSAAEKKAAPLLLGPAPPQNSSSTRTDANGQ
ncbi:Nucleotide exchange factor Fes1 [Dillenia turbinata]|uniref:Nucleotide exchange factor Fes1 n=1 Tax=Dillenia turbinata TaxID=194707 RepID=A0AAN8VY36_9MAGN